MNDVTLISLVPADEDRIDEVASLLLRAFATLSPAWVPTMDSAREVVVEALAPGHINRAMAIDNRIVGWVGARHDYGSVWELHPLVVDESMRDRGLGRALVSEIVRVLEGQAALTLLLGTSDEANLTNLGGRNLFEDPLSALQSIEASRAHPLGFWLRLGFAIVGVVPDAEGIGKPTILLAKAIGRGG